MPADAGFGQSVQVAAGPFEPDKAYWYDDDDRREQLSRLIRACDRLADLFDSRKPNDAVVYRHVAQAAMDLRSGSFDHEQAKALVERLPASPMWLNPKAADYDAPWESWQHQAATARAEARRAAIELRALAKYERP